jgi:hypothetical protein
MDKGFRWLKPDRRTTHRKATKTELKTTPRDNSRFASLNLLP